MSERRTSPALLLRLALRKLALLSRPALDSGALTPPGLVLLSGALFALAGVGLAREAGPRWQVATAATIAVALFFAIFPGQLPDPVRDRVKGGEKSASIYTRWSQDDGS